MSASPPPAPPAPRPQRGLPRTIGVFNLLLGAGLTLCGVGCLGFLGPPLLRNTPLRLEPGQTRDVLEQMRLQMIQDLQAQSRSTRDEAERRKIQTSIDELNATSPDVTGKVDFARINRDLPWTSRYLWAEMVSGLVANVGLILAGIGLVMVKEWGRRLGLAVAALKIVRLVALNGLLAFVVVPRTSDALDQLARTDIGSQFFRHAMEQQNARRPGGGVQLSSAEVVQSIRGMGYGTAVMGLGLGLIYPVVTLVVLTRPGARAACRREAPALSGGDPGQ